MNNEELDSQLSAMFDDELPAPECELLARRLARDEGLKARWGRYAAIGACIRSELGSQAGIPLGQTRVAGSQAGMLGVRLHGDLAGRVSRAVAAEPPLLSGAGAPRSKGLANPAVSRWWQPVAGGAVVAAGVAAAAILWLRAGSPDTSIVAQTPEQTGLRIVAQGSPPASAAGAATAVNGTDGDASDADSYVVPPPSDSASFAPPMELANFVVAHSEYSAPLLRRSVLSALIADESGGGDAVSPPRAASGTAAGNRAAASAARDRAAARSRTAHAGPAR